jgi:hypothetical protein
MHTTTIFALVVLAVAVMHFIDLAETRYRKQARPTTGKQRRNWYCFFSPDTLYGTDSSSRTDQADHRETVEQSQQRQRRLRQEQLRPRLRL